MIIKESLDKQLEVIPKKDVFYCTKCVNSNQRPHLTFNKAGVCDACQWSEMKESTVDWKAREEELRVLLDKHRSKHGSFDVIVPGSGGKDSVYVAHQLKHVYGMHPLTVTWTPHLFTDIGRKNLENWVNSGMNNILYRPDGIIHRKVSRLALELLGDAFEGWSYGCLAFPMQMAVLYNIKLVFYGENQSAEYGGTVDKRLSGQDDYSQESEISYKGHEGIDTLIEKGLQYGRFSKDEILANKATFNYYRLPHKKLLDDLEIEKHWFSYYKKWIPQENYYYATEKCGFEPNPERSEGTYSKYASLDDKTDGFHFYLQFIKFGFGRCTSEAAQEIRTGHITREEGIKLVQKYDGEFPKRYFAEFLEYLDLSEEEFWQIVDKFRPSHLWEKLNDEWRLKYIISE